MRRQWMLSVAVFLLGCIILAGCGFSNRQEKAESQDGAIHLTDDLGREVVLPETPKKIVALSPSFLEPLDKVGASLIGRPTTKSVIIPESAKSAEEIGAVYHINIEKVVSLEPDLVIAYQGMHDKFVPLLESNGIPVIVVRMKSFEDVLDKIVLFARITGDEETGKLLAEQMRYDVRAVTEQVPQKAKKVAILHSTAKSVTVELEKSIAGSVAKMLGLQNVAAGSVALNDDPDSTPYSLEKLVESDPDLIFVVTMGPMEEIQKRMTADVESSPAWSALRAVKDQRIYYLPQELFLLNPGVRYPEAVQTMAGLAYPEVFHDAK